MTNATFLTPLQQARLKFTYQLAEILVQAFDAPCNVDACKNGGLVELVGYVYEATPRYTALLRDFVTAYRLDTAIPAGQWSERQQLNPQLINFLSINGVLPVRVGFTHYNYSKAEPSVELVAHIRRDAIALYLPNGRLNAWAISYHDRGSGKHIPDKHGTHGALYDESGRCSARVKFHPVTSKTLCANAGRDVPVIVPVLGR